MISRALAGLVREHKASIRSALVVTTVDMRCGQPHRRRMQYQVEGDRILTDFGGSRSLDNVLEDNGRLSPFVRYYLLTWRRGVASPGQYCASDVDALARLLPAMLPRIDRQRALLRGRYMDVDDFRAMLTAKGNTHDHVQGA